MERQRAREDLGAEPIVPDSVNSTGHIQVDDGRGELEVGGLRRLLE